MKTLVLLGPYRNLTTLTTALLSLHPNIVAFNHGMVRMPKRTHFYEEPQNRTKYKEFINYILKNYQSGKRGSFGGDIRKCHAFDSSHKTMHRLIKSTEQKENFQNKASQAKAIIWKESGRLTTYLRKNGNFKFFKRIEALLKANPNLIFLRPVRNPVDCTQSNIDTYHDRHTDFNQDNFPNAKNKKHAFLRWLINDLIWFLKLEYCFPDRFIHFNESQFPTERIFQLLDLPPPTPDFLSKMQQGFTITPKPPRPNLQKELEVFLQRKQQNKQIPEEIKALLQQTLQIYLPNQSPNQSN